MAKLISQQITFTVSKLGRDSDTHEITLLDQEVIDQLEAIIAQLVGDGVLIEIESR